MNRLTRIIRHVLNLDYQVYTDYEFQTDKTLNKVMNNFIKDNGKYFNDYTFILNYTDDILGLLSYLILKNIQGVYDFNLKVIGSHKITNSYIFNSEDFISNRKAFFIKKKIKLNCFNPLCYVKNKSKTFKKLDKSKSLISCFTYEQILILCKFFNIDKNKIEIFEPLYCKGTGEYKQICDGSHDGTIKNLTLKENIDIILKEEKPDTAFYKLNGDETDFEQYDNLIKETRVVFYEDMTIEQLDYTASNLYMYISPRNIPSIEHCKSKEDKK